MKTRSSGEEPISPLSEPQQQKQLRAKAAKLDPSKDVYKFDDLRDALNVDPHQPVAMAMTAEQLAELQRELEAERERLRKEAEDRPRRQGFYEDDGIYNNDRPRERTNYSPIVRPGPEGDWALKTNIIANLPKFHGGPIENPHNHLKLLTNQIETIKPPNINIDLAKLKAFPWTMEKSAQVWFDSLTPGSITTWEQMAEIFLRKYWSKDKVDNFEKEIVAFNQTKHMTYCEYYRNWIATQELWPLTSLSRKQIIGYFISGLKAEEKEKLAWYVGGNLNQMTNTEKMELLEKVYGVRAAQEDDEDSTPKGLHRLESRMNKMQDSMDDLKTKSVYAVKENTQEVCNFVTDDLVSNPNDVSVQNEDELIPVNAEYTQNIPPSKGFPFGGAQHTFRYRSGYNQQNGSGWNQQGGQSQNQNQNQQSGQGQGQNQQRGSGQGNWNNNQGQGGWNNNQGQGQNQAQQRGSGQGNWDNNQGRQQQNQRNVDPLEAYMTRNDAMMKSLQEQVQLLINAG